MVTLKTIQQCKYGKAKVHERSQLQLIQRLVNAQKASGKTRQEKRASKGPPQASYKRQTLRPSKRVQHASYQPSLEPSSPI